ncbi:FHA domain protein [Mycobacterium kansasii]|uniref:FHA domain protein n=1 Tax=Mycobacterium kansasii TaxID=1768 RepID=A0A1V3WVV7_MYCKA|nr:FHA domain protein [Mycobacterium kansasii]
MPNADSPVGPALLAAHSGEPSHAIAPDRDVVTIGRTPRAGVQIDDPDVSQAHLRAVSEDGPWRILGSSPSGMFVDGRRKGSVTVSDKTIVRFGDPTGGKALTFEVVRPSNSPEEQRREQRPADQSDGQSSEPDPGVVRAGAAAAARRRELDISQRSLAADGIINAGALIAFEKGRSWPRERTRAKLEEVLQWPPGTIARIRQGEPAGQPAISASEADAEAEPAEGPASLIAQAVAAAIDTCSLAIAALPPPRTRVHRAGSADPRRFAPTRGHRRTGDSHQSYYPRTDQGTGRGAPLPRQIDDAGGHRPGPRWRSVYMPRAGGPIFPLPKLHRQPEWQKK